MADETWTCTKCNRNLPASEYHSRRKGRYQGRRYWCKSCTKRYFQEWRKSPTGRVSVERERAKQRQRNQVQKREAIDAYGGKCACCGETELVFLAIDHEKGGGNQHRKATGMGKGPRAYRWLRDRGYPEGFRVLCHNCNFATYRGICPHAQKRGESEANG